MTRESIQVKSVYMLREQNSNKRLGAAHPIAMRGMQIANFDWIVFCSRIGTLRCTVAIVLSKSDDSIAAAHGISFEGDTFAKRPRHLLATTMRCISAHMCLTFSAPRRSCALARCRLLNDMTTNRVRVVRVASDTPLCRSHTKQFKSGHLAKSGQIAIPTEIINWWWCCCCCCVGGIV